MWKEAEFLRVRQQAKAANLPEGVGVDPSLNWKILTDARLYGSHQTWADARLHTEPNKQTTQTAQAITTKNILSRAEGKPTASKIHAQMRCQSLRAEWLANRRDASFLQCQVVFLSTLKVKYCYTVLRGTLVACHKRCKTTQHLLSCIWHTFSWQMANSVA